MIRLLQLLLLVALAVIAWRLLRKALAPPPAAGVGENREFEPTARCARCDTHVPRGELDAAGLCARCRT